MNEPIEVHPVDEPPHCSRCESPLEEGDLRCAICGQAAPHADHSHAKHVSVTLLRCTGCGAAITYDPDHQAPACSFCGEVLRVETIDDPMEQTETYLPMTVSIEEARAALKAWLDSLGWFRPSDLSSASTLTEIKPLWWVAWIFDAEALVSWTADSNAGAGRSAWAPHSGQTPLRFDDMLVSGSRGLTDQEAYAITPGMQLGSGTDSVVGGGDQPTLERFDVPRSQARQQVLAAIERTAADRIRAHHIPGTSFRKVRVAIVLRRLITRRYSLPAYVLAYRYRDELYRVVICGQNARFIVGSSPFSYAKLFLLVGGIILVVLFFAVIAAASS
ncbi:putative RNA-binding Zn-ribbon protein involved in translation (DUF1610 family) [Rhodopirellula rubra]|uniref:Putative RNA-binding Zn-ribbon protein involved in translation (DUF1610 family) n=1 Tax=Aporhodopirellula rubra TaxID=980271 RepID=A0A7W5DZL8_9BACT|nr:hypothetical protein [Aporhodopirellula rubra]MBB3207464.1 putative RNA-binding Zn-ribbon protein involved in translation (DUF1610 family) [Aporhodopirellula rubra]